MRARALVAGDQTGQIDREKAGRMRRLAQSENDERAGRDKDRMQALRHAEAIEHEHKDLAADVTDQSTADALDGKAGKHERQRLVAAQQHFNNDNSEEDR